MFSATSAAAAIATRRARGDSCLSTECSKAIIGPQPESRARFHAGHAIPPRYGLAPLAPRPPRLRPTAQHASTGCSRHAAGQRVIDLDDTYRRLARPWSREQLADLYRAADERGARGFGAEDDDVIRPVALLATAFPRAATLSVAIHVLHALPPGARGTVGQELVDTAERNAGDVLSRCHRALELDGAGRGYTTDEFLPIVYETAAALLESADRARSHRRSYSRRRRQSAGFPAPLWSSTKTRPRLRPPLPTRSLACSPYGCSQTLLAIDAMVSRKACKHHGQLVPEFRA
jgi:hypothetical protein